MEIERFGFELIGDKRTLFNAQLSNCIIINTCSLTNIETQPTNYIRICEDTLKGNMESMSSGVASG